MSLSECHNPDMRPPRFRAVRAPGRKLIALALIGAVLVISVLLFSSDTAGVLGWLRKHWLNAVAVTAFGTLLVVAVTLVAPFLVQGRARAGRRAAARAAREREPMLRRVRYQWIKQVLEPSLADAAYLALGLELRTDVLPLGHRMIWRANQQPKRIPDGVSITQIFDEIGGGLLILGAPGAGKTTLLLQLADGLLDRAEDDRRQPIPVVLNVASWAVDGLPLDRWLVEELATSYKVPKPTRIDLGGAGSIGTSA